MQRRNTLVPLNSLFARFSGDRLINHQTGSPEFHWLPAKSRATPNSHRKHPLQGPRLASRGREQ